ncbi:MULTISPECIES: hypothetical protein [Actinoallomurus]|uniref:hypothetical protein n=1 Tax=Actinoallomurus TaxID=667113 RepID=UPI0020924287|nr:MULTISPECIES: hypothetical protein [Actinoallomurus]MCO5973929.1 hypothetical protein [Actinoallomurus soli]MCO5999926.1 hypothetical protein [Actinoallomurus rhizosphaericola]
MSILAWWAIPVAVALLTGALMTLRGRRPRVRGSFEEIEHFKRFRDALEGPRRKTRGRRPRSTA